MISWWNHGGAASDRSTIPLQAPPVRRSRGLARGGLRRDVGVERVVFQAQSGDAQETFSSGANALFVASPGGHLAELVELGARLPRIGRVTWVTPPTPQSLELLAGQRWLRSPDVKPRDVRALARAAGEARRTLRGEHFDLVLSTGAGLALAWLPQAAARGVTTHYVESAARVAGPSLTGRLLEAAPGVHLWTQYKQNTNDRWSFLGSVFEQYKVVGRPPRRSRPLKVVVTLGTMQSFSFRRLVDRLRTVLPSDAEVTWQSGASDRLGIEGVRPWISPSELEGLMSRADVVVAHAGVGSALAAMRVGAFPILVPRRAAHLEHVDDHQRQIGAYLASLGLAFCSEVEDITPALLTTASHLMLKRVAKPLPQLTFDRQSVVT